MDASGLTQRGHRDSKGPWTLLTQPSTSVHPLVNLGLISGIARVHMVQVRLDDACHEQLATNAKKT